MIRRVSLLAALCLLLGIFGGCGSRDAGPDSSDTGFGSAVESVTEDQETIEAASETESDTGSRTGSFSMPYNDSYGWDPYSCIGMENRAVMQLIYESLFIMDTAYDPVPVLCKDYTVSDDGLVYTLELQDAAFSSGKDMTAGDVVYSMQLAAQSSVYGNRFDDILSYYAADTSTVIVELSVANDRLPCLLDFPIIPSGSSTSAPLGTGPFVRTDNVLTVNPQWWQGASTLNFQTVTLYSSSSAEDTRDYFEIDYVHFVYNDPCSSTATSNHGNYELWDSGGTVMQYIGFNCMAGIFQDYELRAAVTHAIDRSGIAESVYHNFADPAALPVSPASSLYDTDLAARYTFTSAEDAMAEMAESTYFEIPPTVTAAADDDDETGSSEETGEGEADTEDAEEPEEAEEEITYNNITMFVMEGNLSRVAAANQAAQNLTDAGFTVTVTTYSSDEFAYALSNYYWDIYYGEVTLKPDFDLRSLLTYGGSLNYSGLGLSDTLTELISAAMENSGNRYDLYEYIMDRGYICPVLFLNNAVYTTRGVFTDLNPSPDFLFYQISNIHINHN